jgi:hypothetical protein
VYPSSTLSMLNILIYFCFFIAQFLLVKNTRKINIAYRKISYNRNPVNDVMNV